MDVRSRPPWVVGEGFVEARVRLTPRSRVDAIDGLDVFDRHVILKARVRALPSEGAANRALEKLFATWLGVPKSAVKVSGGLKSRVKTVRLLGETADLETAILGRLDQGS